MGTPEHIAERIAARRKRGVDLILGGLLQLREEIEYFGSRVLPRVGEIGAAEEDSADRRVLAPA
jgi:dimethylsulfone monooxygenase